MRPWDAKDKALLFVSHKTRLSYAEPVIEAHSEVRKTPVHTGLQKVVTSTLTVSPSAKLQSYDDYFGSRVHEFNVLDPHTELVILSESVVETTDAVCCGPAAHDEDPRPWRERLSEYLHWSPSVPYLPEYAEIDHRVSVDLAGEEFLVALEELGAYFVDRFRYDPAATDVQSSPKELFEAGGGVCQDFAHAMIGALRSAGVPSRYVSGYFYDPASTGDDEESEMRGAGASHAWVQVWHPELGWVGIDPTNDKLVDWQYIRVAAGRDYSDVQPLRGIFVGPHEQELEVVVKVRRIG